MKKLCLILAYLFLFTQTASAMPLLVGQKVVYRGTVTDLRISAVDGTAFIDNLPYTYSSDFSAGVDGWTAGRGTVAGNIDDIPATDDNWLRFTVNTELGAHSAVKSISFVAGRTYTISFNYYIPSGQTIVAGIVPTNESGVTIGASGLTLDAITTYTILYTPQTTNTELKIYATNAAGSANIQDAGGDDVFYIKDIKISEIQPFIDGNHSIEIYDSSNRMLKGVLKAAGTSETLGDAANVNNCENYSSALYDVFTDATPTSFHAENTSAGTKRASTADEIVVAVGELWNVSATIETLSGLKPLFQFRSNPGGAYLGAPVIPVFNDGNNSWYTTTVRNDTGVVEILSTSTNSFNISNLAAKQVLTPSSAGATIVSTKGGDVYNFSYKNASFAYNAASYYVIIRAIR